MTPAAPAIYVNGSAGEGGGQILRTSVALAALLGAALEIDRIRAHRKKPGLRPQHLTAVEAVARITGAAVEGATLGSCRLHLRPGSIRGGDYVFDVAQVQRSAGSVGLLLQAVLPVLAFASTPSSLVLRGGTHVPWSPPAEYLRQVFTPTVEAMHLHIELETEEWGWYPEGGGRMRAAVAPVPILQALDLTERGELEEIVGLSAVSNLPRQIAARQREQALGQLEAAGLDAGIEQTSCPSPGKGTAVFLLARYERALAGFSALGARGKPAEQVADEAVAELLAHHRTAAAVDPFLADQVVLYMALAGGRSAVTVSRISQHLLTNIQVVERFLPVRFAVEGDLGEAGRVAVEGISYRGRGGLRGNGDGAAGLRLADH